MKKLFSLILAVLILSGCAAVPTPEPISAVSVAEASYPSMAPYPNEADFIDPRTGIFDDEGFSEVYDAWRGNLELQEDIPQGYADSLLPCFQQSIPAFLDVDGENAVCSPLNICMALAMLAEVTDGDTRDEILNLTGADSMDSLRIQAGRIWRSHYSADGASACVLANSLWLDSGLTYNADTVNRLASDHYASVFQGDLGSEEANQLLRDWLNEQTGGLLQDQVQNVSFDPMTVLAIATTINYQVQWRDFKFSESANTKGVFHGAKGDTTETFMHSELSYGPYYWSDHFGAVALPLEDGSQMWLFLPDEGISPEEIAQEAMAFLADPNKKDQKQLRVNLSLPKFDVSSQRDVAGTLQQLGITDVFDGSKADFSPILPSDDGGYVNEINHATRVMIGEKGVTAAAFTVIMRCGAAMPPEDEVDFILDKPFLFAITGETGLPLFMGVVQNPA